MVAMTVLVPGPAGATSPSGGAPAGVVLLIRPDGWAPPILFAAVILLIPLAPSVLLVRLVTFVLLVLVGLLGALVVAI
jgi:hypothetical protein